MADENDPDRPEGDPPATPPTGEGGAAPIGALTTAADELDTFANEATADDPPSDVDILDEQPAPVLNQPDELLEPKEITFVSAGAEEPEVFEATPPPIEPIEDVQPSASVETPSEPRAVAAPQEPSELADEPPITSQKAPAAPEETAEPLDDISEPEAQPIAAREIEFEPTAAEQTETRAPETAELPANYFRAAGDPDEPPDEAPPPTLLHKARAKAKETWKQFRTAAEPKWVAFAGGARAFGGEMWARLRGIKRPRTVREAAVWGGWVAAGGVALIVGFFFFVTAGMPSTDDLWEARQGQSITFLDRNGHVILREGAQNAPPVDLASLPPYVEQAFIAIEDRRFYNHMGVDFGGMMRAGAENLRAGRVVQGGSTITQQLAKNLFLTNERSWRRKAQEIVLALWLESRFSKEEILALYLSRVYFGAGAYGIEAAAERYFDRPARELTLLQSAMIAGLVKAPSRLNPARQDIGAATERATIVLNEMVAMGFISAAEREAALQEELLISRQNPAGVLSYYRDWIDPLLNDVIGNQRDDFVIETTIDIAAQRAAAEAIETLLAEQGEDRRVSQAAAIAVDDQGGVRAIVGGRDYTQSQFNRATQARRQPGSSFKFFIYLAAMENGLTPWSVREDAPITISIEGQPDWTPGNYTNEFHGAVTLSGAFTHSFNMVAIRVANEVGGDKVIDVARRLGVTSPLSNYHSLALGAQEMTLVEMVGAYGAMAADGYRVEPHGVARIRRANSNETMWTWRTTRRDRVIEERPMRYMNQMMARVVAEGTGTRARVNGFQIGGKTGTGNDYRDAWFIGFTPGMVAGVWVGNDNFTTTARVTGGSLPADIWARFMPTVLRNTPSRPLEMPRDEDYDLGVPDPEAPTLTAIGAPVGAMLGTPADTPPDDKDRSLDFGPEG